jgi:hypothetical protein
MTRRTIFLATVLVAALVAEPAMAIPRSPMEAVSSPLAHRSRWAPLGGGSVAPDLARPGWAVADVTGPIPIFKTRRPDELAYAESDEYEAWGTVERQDRFRVYARKKGERRHRVHSASYDAAMGGVDGNRLVYQEIRFLRARSNIRLYDIATKRRTNPGRRVNSRLWEYWPSISGEWILFFRTNLDATRRWAFLYNMSTNQRRQLQATRGQRNGLFGGQVSVSEEGAFATWTRCARRTCNVFRYNIKTGTRSKIPNPGRRVQYAAGVDPSGTVYYARSGFRCGRNVGLWKHSPGGSPAKLVSLPRNIDLARGFVHRNVGAGRNQYSFDRLNCRTFRSDIFQIWDDDIVVMPPAT